MKLCRQWIQVVASRELRDLSHVGAFPPSSGRTTGQFLWRLRKNFFRTFLTGISKPLLSLWSRKVSTGNSILLARCLGRASETFKHTFYAILGNRRLTDEILTTVFCLVEQSLNARPLVPASADATDMDALTPNYFLLGTAVSSLPCHSNCDLDHRKRYARAQAYSDAIWSRWLKEYVPTLNRRAKWSTQSDRQLKTGHLVWMVEATSPRGYYPLARVVKLHFGNDAVARSAEVKTTSRNLVRPVVKLAPVLHPTDLADSH